MMRTKYLFLLPFIFFLFSSCGDKKDSENNPYYPKLSADTLDIQVGFPFDARSFEYKGKSYIYLFDLVTYKKVKLYDEDLNWIKTFSVDRFSEMGLYLSDIVMLTPDSVLLLTDYHANTLISLNTKTGKSKSVSLNKIVQLEGFDVPMEFLASNSDGFVAASRILFMLTPSISGVSVKYPRPDVMKGIKTYDSISKLLPAFIEIQNPFSENPSFTIIDKSSKLKETLKDSYNYHQAMAFFGNNEIIYTSANFLFFDIYNLKIGSSYVKPIKSKYSRISIPNRTWKEIEKNPSIMYNDLPRRELYEAGRVHRIFFDGKKNCYHVFLYYDKSSGKEELDYIKPFIWQIYDANFNLLTEREHTNLDVDCNRIIKTKKYLYFPYYNDETNDPEQALLLRYTF